jgi:antitoxin (DNA-binding transcriptional repressor) of toxin-antitoxin stability system
MKTITATEAVRKFSEILNSIKYAGADYTIMRGGKPVAMNVRWKIMQRN